jgi:hypothetical protein
MIAIHNGGRETVLESAPLVLRVSARRGIEVTIFWVKS